MVKLLACALLLAALALDTTTGQGSPTTFTLKAENLPTRDDHTKADPYVKLYVYHSSGSNAISLVKVGQTSVEIDNENPSWSEAFSVPLQVGHSQKLRLQVLDADLTNSDDVIGFVDIDVDQFLANRSGAYRAALSDGGVVIITRTTPLKFKLNASNVPRKDRYWGYDGPSDPYVEVYYRNSQNGPDNLIVKSSTIDDSDNPIWPEQFEFSQYQRGSGQYLFFKVYDYDMFSADDFIGQASIAVDDLVEHRVSNTLSLGSKNVAATITVRLT